MAWAIRKEGDRVGGRIRVQKQTVKGNSLRNLSVFLTAEKEEAYLYEHESRDRSHIYVTPYDFKTVNYFFGLSGFIISP